MDDGSMNWSDDDESSMDGWSGDDEELFNKIARMNDFIFVPA